MSAPAASVRVVGLMSGTSFDAVETAAADLRLEGDELVFEPLGARSTPYDPPLRAAIGAALPPAAVTAEAVCRLDTEVGQAFAAAAADAVAAVCGGHADLVVSHGQTLYHWVDDTATRGSLQLGQPAWIAERTGLPVVSDLRNRDIAAGGQGAPLVSRFDALLLADQAHTRAALNLGGIANLTVLTPRDDPFAFDVGPANALIDAAVAEVTGGAATYDADGTRAARGRIHQPLLDRLLADPYYLAPAPKSTGKEHFHGGYLRAAVDAVGAVDPDDLVATTTALAARTVADALTAHDVTEVVVAGGGTHNPTLMAMLHDAAADVRLVAIEEWGIPTQAKEAYAFAVLGFLSLHGLAGTVPSCTGASRATVLGGLTPGRGPLRLPAPADRAPRRLRIDEPDPAEGAP